MIQLDEAAIQRALPLVAEGLRKYCWLQAALATTDIANDREFQTRFNAFYRVRRSSAWRRVFYALLEQEKSKPRPFAYVLRALHAATGRAEASFASKLVASVDPDMPVIDAFVLKKETVAEAVEDRATWTMLRDMGCTSVQGFFTGPPMDRSDLAEWARTRDLPPILSTSAAWTGHSFRDLGPRPARHSRASRGTRQP